MTQPQKKEIAYPAEITVKSVFRAGDAVPSKLESILSETATGAVLSAKESRNANFVSYTITAVFASDAALDETCSRISSIEGFMMIF